MDCPGLKERVVLVVEDEPFIAMHIVLSLKEAGAYAVSAANLAHALEFTQTMAFNAAVVDVHLAGGDCRSVCAYLSKAGIPFLFYTGYAMSDIFAEWPQAPVITKPASNEQLLLAVERLTVPKAPDGCTTLA